MISVQNHRPLLNGNKTLLLLSGLILLLPSCELLKPVSDATPSDKAEDKRVEVIQGSRVYNPQTDAWETVQQASAPMDTIVWRETNESTYPPILSKPNAFPIQENALSGRPAATGEPIRIDNIGSSFYDTYKIALLLPLFADQSVQPNAIDPNALWGLHFLSGFRMALDELALQGHKLQVSVHDTRADERTTAELLRSNAEIKAAHLIVGPYKRENVAMVAQQIQNTQQVLVSPYSAAANISSANPNYLQINPTLETHCRSIMAYVYDKFERDAVVLVTRDDSTEINRLQFFNDEYQRLNGGKDTFRLQQLKMSNIPAGAQNNEIIRYLDNNRSSDTTVFIVPSWADESAIGSLLDQIFNSLDTYQEAIVFGMPQWMNYEQLDLDLFNELNLHITSSTFIDPLRTDQLNFKMKFFERFGDIPREEAYNGYSIAQYFSNQLKEHGTRFQYAIENEPQNVLHTRFAFKKVIRANPVDRELPIIDRWENKFVNILRFQDYQFVPVNR